MVFIVGLEVPNVQTQFSNMAHVQAIYAVTTPNLRFAILRGAKQSTSDRETRLQVGLAH